MKLPNDHNLSKLFIPYCRLLIFFATFGPRSGTTECQAWSGSSDHIPERIFSKKLIKKISIWQKMGKKIPRAKSWLYLCLVLVQPRKHPNLAGILTLKAPIATKVVCFSLLLKCLRSLYDKQCGPRSDCSYRSSLIRVHTVCFYT